MKRILVSGLINVETTLRVDGFPIFYGPVRYPFFGVNSSVSGVGYNVAKALTKLGNTVHLLSLVGTDLAGQLVYQALAASGISSEGVLAKVAQTPQSVILYDADGRRQINVDLKNIQEQAYTPERFGRALRASDMVVLCNVNFSRHFLDAARAAGKLVATDVHAIADLEDDYNRDFMAAADILFMSDEQLPCRPEEWAQQVQRRFEAEIVVIGLGGEGALLAVRRDNFVGRFPTVFTRNVVNTIGAGDALFSAFVHEYLATGDPYLAIKKGIVFASYKIGTAGAADGFLTADELAQLYARVSRDKGRLLGEA